MNKYCTIMPVALMALGQAGIAVAGPGAQAFCAPGNNIGVDFTSSGGPCWRLEVKCAGGTSGSAHLGVVFGGEGDLGDWTIGGELGESASCFSSGVFQGAKQVNAKCKLEGGGKLEMQAQPAPSGKCNG